MNGRPIPPRCAQESHHARHNSDLRGQPRNRRVARAIDRARPLDSMRMTTQQLFVNASQVVTCAGPPRAAPRPRDARRRRAHRTPPSPSSDGRIVGRRPAGRARAPPSVAARVDCARGVLTPGLVDSHTHGDLRQAARSRNRNFAPLAWATWRSRRSGGGIHSSVRDLRARTEDELFALALPRVRRLAAYGTTTVELKSGYGLTLDDELKSLRVIRRLQHALAHAHRPDLPRRARDPARVPRRAAHARRVRRPAHRRDDPARRAREARRCSPTSSASRACTRSTSRAAILGAARAHGLALKLHADELEPRRRGRARGRTRRHQRRPPCRDLTGRDRARSPRAGTVATLLPGTMLFLGQVRAGAGARADRRRRGRRARHRFQPGHVAHGELSADAHAGGEPASPVASPKR